MSVSFICLLKNIFPFKFVIEYDGCLIPGCLSLLAVLVKNHFLPIFAICMALHCSKESGWEKAAIVPQSSILRLAEISGSERDKLIKEHKVCISFSSLSLYLKDSGTLRSMTCVKVLV